MTEKQKEAVKIVLQQVLGSHLDVEEAMTLIDSIIGEQLVIPTYPYNPITPYYGTGAPEFQPPYRVTCEFQK